MGRVTATVLFTDLVGSTELRGRLGEEAADELRRRHDQVLAQAVEANNGRVVKGLGDGIMATFGGASDAVGAAVAMQQGIDRLNRSGRAPVPLAVRVGLSAGDVGFEDDDVHGTPVIEASRLCAVGEGGEVLIADVVRALAGLADEAVGERGRLELKGLQKPVAAWEVRWEPAAVSAVPMPTLLTDVGRIFVGRDAEFERLQQLWKEAAAGDRRVVLLAGEPGVGKTRLAAEVAIRVHEQGAVVLGGRCDEDLGVPYQPFVEALRHFADHAPEVHLGRYGGELLRLVPELAERVAELSPPLQSDPETERYRLFDAVAAWLTAASSDGPVLLVLDDLQWAAKPTLLLLRHVVRSSELKGILVVGTYRDSELGHDHPLVEVLADLRRQDGVERISVGGLDSGGVAAFMERAAGHAMGDAELALARAIHEETEGNPFFVREVLRHLAETGAIERLEGRWGTHLPVEELGIPESVREVVGRRVSRLSKQTNQVVRIAAVVGPEFDLPVVQAAGSMDGDALVASLEEAVEARLIIEEQAHRYRFAHALVRDTVYGGLSATRRVELHRRVAEAIEAAHQGFLDDHLPALAHHWARASAPAAASGKAVEYAARAGDRALAQLANDEAVTYYRQALELLETVEGRDEQQLTAILISLGEAQRRAGDPEHRETLLRAAQLAAEQGDADAMARAALANTRGSWASVIGEIDDDRVVVLEAALEALGDLETPTRARLLAALGLELTYAGEWERRTRLADEALAIGRRCGDAATLANVLLRRFTTINLPHTLDERLANTTELVGLSENLGDPTVTAWAQLLRFRALVESGDMGKADRCLTAAEQLGGEIGQPTHGWFVGAIGTARTILAGNLEEGERRAQEMFALGQASGQRDAQTFLASHLFFIRYDQGRLGEVEECLAERVAMVPRFALFRALLALLLCELDRPDDASAHYEMLAAGDFTGIPTDNVWSQTLSPCAAVCASLGDRVRAPVLFEMLAPYADQIAFNGGGSSGSVAHYLALLATTIGDFDEAERRFAQATETHARIAAPIWLARTRLESARMLLSRRRPGDSGRASALLDKALGTARERGAGSVEQKAVALLQDCP
jgi:class 3 adenylate cyclase/tetratricopeptide (TPR) repeat protein